MRFGPLGASKRCSRSILKSILAMPAARLKPPWDPDLTLFGWMMKRPPTFNFPRKTWER